MIELLGFWVIASKLQINKDALPPYESAYPFEPATPPYPFLVNALNSPSRQSEIYKNLSLWTVATHNVSLRLSEMNNNELKGILSPGKGFAQLMGHVFNILSVTPEMLNELTLARHLMAKWQALLA